MASRRVYVGNLSSRTDERDLDDCFYKFGRINKIDLKNGFAFVEFDDDRDAEDAVRDRDGYDLNGRRIAVEFAKGTKRTGRDGGRDGGDGGGRFNHGGRGGGHRVDVEGLDERVSWQDLKDFARQAGGEVAYTDVWMDRGKKCGVIEYVSKRDMDDAISELDDTKVDKHNCFVRLYETNKGKSSGSASPSRSRSPARKDSRSPARKKKSRSPSRSRSRSRGGDRDSKKKSRRGRSRSRS